MASITPVKTNSVEVLAHQAAVHPTTIIGNAINCATKKSATLVLLHGYVEAVADTNPGKFLIQVRPDSGGSTVNEHWVTVAELIVKGTTPDTEPLTATEPAGEISLACASTTGFVAEDELYIQDTGNLVDSEWGKLKTFVANTSLTLIDGLTNQKDSADVVWNDASKFVTTINLNSIEAFRVIWMHEGAVGANGHVKVVATTYDSDLIV